MDQRTNYPLTLDGQPIGANNLTPPLISIVVVNWNYAEFVGGMIDSIRGQDYAWFECFVIDNGSTDDSRAVIERHIGGDPRFATVHLQKNLGQLHAAVGVLDRLRGFFVVVADADDLLMPNFLSSHVQVHLALPSPVGFTSSNIVETDTDGRVLSGGGAYFARSCESEPRGLLPISDALRLSVVSAGDYEALSAQSISIAHWKTQWVWSPGTSNMYRRSLLLIARPDLGESDGHRAFDNYFHRAIQVIAGSALIDRPLSIYRYHGRNSTTNLVPPLPTINNWTKAKATQATAHRREVLRTFVRDPERFDWTLGSDRYWATLDLLAGFDGMTPQQFFGDPGVQPILLEAYDALAKYFDERALLSTLLDRMNTRNWRNLVSEHYAGRIPLALRMWMLRKILGRRIRRVVRRR